jgi:GNAT superfamily N-acetyltransferase
VTVEVREPTDDDVTGILELLSVCLGWGTDDDFRRLYRWTLDENPFGPSARWVAIEGDRIIGFRAFLRWQFERDGQLLDAVRAVDTATAPDVRGRGVFRQLTLHGLDAIGREGVAFVFNTPNPRSGKGYETMGWRDVGRPRPRVRPRSIGGIVRMLTAGPDDASRWSEPCTIGEPVESLLVDPSALTSLLESRSRGGALHTAITPEYVRWRYDGAFPARVVAHPDGVDHGVAFVRVRRRGRARVAILGDVLVPQSNRALVRPIVRRIAASNDADGTVALGRTVQLRDGFVPMGRAPRLVARAVNGDPPWTLEDWDVGYGDLELL